MLYRLMAPALVAALSSVPALASEPAKPDTPTLTRGTPKQCFEMQRNLDSRRQRVDRMNDGERSDLRRFETIHKERCGNPGS